jgi:hypothetical protein
MESIGIPTYKTIIPNEVFGRKGDGLKRSLVGNVPSTEVLLVQRYRIPRRDDVSNFIAKKAGEIALIKERGESSGRGVLLLLERFSKPEIEKIASRDEKSLEGLMTHYPESDFEEGRWYIEAHNGMILDGMLNSMNGLYDALGLEIYERAIEDLNRHDWKIRVRLSSEGLFPDSLEMEYLLDRGVRDCDVFSIRGNFRDYGDVASHARILYRAFNDKKIIEMLRDNSHELLDEKASHTLVRATGYADLSRAFEDSAEGGCAPVFDRLMGNAMAAKIKNKN